MKASRLRPLSLVFLLVASCASPYSKVKVSRPAWSAAWGAVGALGSGSAGAKRLAAAGREEDRAPREAIGKYLDAAYEASRRLAKQPGDGEALREYNFALSRAFGVLSRAQQNPWVKPLAFPGAAGKWEVSAQREARHPWKAADFELRPADAFELKGSYVTTRSLKAGLGAPLVVTAKSGDYLATDPFAQGRHIYYGATAIARFEGRRCVVSFEDPLSTETVSYGGHRFPLAADFTAPLAVALAAENPKTFELARLLRPGKYAESARLARLQSYDPAKIPVICVHGLMDSQATWVPIINALRADPAIRAKYQFWFYSYPSGYPYPYSASIFRRQMDAIKRRYPDHRNAVLIGHSMGGIISRAMITSSGDALWKTYFTEPPEKTGLERDAKQLMREALIFESRKDVDRAIFIAAPHRGTDLASDWIGRLGSKLVHGPATLMSVSSQVMSLVTLDSSSLKMKGMPNSVDTLAPNNRFVKAINEIPINPSIPYHSIMGDRGKGDSPNSSDGFVPYWSSHLEGAVSEKIVPSGHSAHQNPEAIEEVRRILLLHAKSHGGLGSGGGEGADSPSTPPPVGPHLEAYD